MFGKKKTTKTKDCKSEAKSDMTSGSRSTKSCGAKAGTSATYSKVAPHQTKASSTKSCSSKASK